MPMQPEFPLEQSKKLFRAVTDHRLIADPSEVEGLVDSSIFICLERSRRSPGIPAQPQASDGFLDPQAWIDDLAQTGSLGISYACLFEILDISPGKPTLSPADKAAMYDRMRLIKTSGLKIVEVTRETFRLAMDLWFDVRQGRVARMHNVKNLFDPLIAATGIDTGLPIYTTNYKHFKPYTAKYPLRSIHVLHQPGGNGLRLAHPS